jgi:hypothetical protein
MLETLRGAADGFLGDGRDGNAPASHQPAAAAHMFNETGLFGRAVDDPGPGQAAPETAAPRPGVAVQDAAAVPAACGAEAGTAASEPAVALRPVARTGREAPAPGAPWAGANVHAAPASAARSTAMGQAPIRTKSLQAAPAERRPARRPVEEARRERSASAARLALQPGADGLAVVARAERLSREEQIRLRVAIEALLARHGLAARRVTINGEAEPRGGSGGE